MAPEKDIEMMLPTTTETVNPLASSDFRGEPHDPVLRRIWNQATPMQRKLAIGAGAVCGAVAVFQSGRASAQSQDATTERGWFSSTSGSDFCGVCANAPSRGWSWWFGYGDCECYHGWEGACCDIEVCQDNVDGNGDTCYTLYTTEEYAEAQNSVFGTAGYMFTKGIDWIFGADACQIQDEFPGQVIALFGNLGSNVLFERVNFVDGFSWFDNLWESNSATSGKFKQPVAGETIDIVPYSEVTDFDYGENGAFMDYYYTGATTPSWEDDHDHNMGIAMLGVGLEAQDDDVEVGEESCRYTHNMEPRYELDHDLLMDSSWEGFSWMNRDEVKYGSNGDFGRTLLEEKLAEYGTQDVLGIMASETIFGMHLHYCDESNINSNPHCNKVDEFYMDFDEMAGTGTRNTADWEEYVPIYGYEGLGGTARFEYDSNDGEFGRLKTTEICFPTPSDCYTPGEDQAAVDAALAENKWVGWKWAEKCIITSLLSQTNLIIHVKGLHLEIAAAFQAVTLNTFKDATDHPWRRLLDQFTHRSIQATNANFDLLFKYKAAEFSLAPLPWQEQLRMINDYITNHPLSLRTMHMDGFAEERNMENFNEKDGKNKFWWRWHYRARAAQTVFEDLIDCWIDSNYGDDDSALYADAEMQAWWANLKQYLPSLTIAVEEGLWIGDGELTRENLKKVTSTIMVWVSWIHEDVGHAASYFVYNPIHTPMAVPKDGTDESPMAIGVPLGSFAFNVNAYRTFVFLERGKFMDSDPADHWFDGASNDRQCYTDFQDTVRNYGANDIAFSECGETGFYSCVENIETAVSS